MTDQHAVAHPAATVVLLREGEGAFDVLLVQRNAKLSFHGGAWVFPGGRVDEEDYAGNPDDIIAAARRAAAREAREEAGLEVAAEDMVLISRWVTPTVLPKRFDTWFFAAGTRAVEVQIDGGEIHGFRWFRPADALQAQRRGEIELPPPTYVTLLRMAEHRTVAEALAKIPADPVETFLPKLCPLPEGACTLYHGDVAYETGEVDKPGPRHRLVMSGTEWRYERRGLGVGE